MRIAVSRNLFLISSFYSSTFAAHAASQEDAGKLRRTAAAKSDQDFRQAYDSLQVSINNMQDCAEAKGPRSCPRAIADVVFATRDVAVASLADGLQDNKEGLFGKDDPPVVANPMVHNMGTVFSDCDDSSGTNNGAGFSSDLNDCCEDAGCEVREGQTTWNSLTQCDETPVFCDCGSGYGWDDLNYDLCA